MLREFNARIHVMIWRGIRCQIAIGNYSPGRRRRSDSGLQRMRWRNG